MERKAILGAWSLVSFAGRNAKGETRALMGSGARGLLIYTDDGFMSAVISSGKRAPFKSADSRAGTPEEIGPAFKNYMSYCGRYTLSGDEITHHVEMSLFPNWIGGDQRRFAALRGGELVLSTPPMRVAGDEWVYELVWRRP
jgi:hypothetical protein